MTVTLCMVVAVLGTCFFIHSLAS